MYIRSLSFIFSLMMTALLSSFGAWAAPTSADAKSIKRPQQLGVKTPEKAFRCDRLIRWKNENLPCDSPLLWDGENLRPIMANTPSAIEELDQYQRGRRSIRNAAYVGTAGLVFTLGSSLIAGMLKSDDHARGKKDVKDTFWYGGLGVMGGAVLYGYTTLRSNEKHLQNAIVRYNTAQPGTPIEVLFQKEF